jgi:hypothetical protein
LVYLFFPFLSPSFLFSLSFRVSLGMLLLAYYISATKIKRLMLSRETIAVYCENHVKNTNTICGEMRVVLC